MARVPLPLLLARTVTNRLVVVALVWIWSCGVGVVYHSFRCVVLLSLCFIVYTFLGMCAYILSEMRFRV